MKKIKSLILAVVMCAFVVGGTACSSKNFVGAPDYSTNTEKFHIGAWIAPPPACKSTDYVNYATLEQYQVLADSGINTIYALYNTEEANIISDLDLAEKVGIDYYARDYRINQLVDLTEEEAAQSTMFDSYKNKKAFKGHLAVDEPGADQFEWIASLKPKYEKVFKNKDFYINLFPTYASNASLKATYYDYIDQFIKKTSPKMLSYDSYSLLTDAYGKTSLQEDYLMNKEIIARKAQKAGIPFWTFIQSIGFGMANRSPKSEGDIRFQVYSDLAYGASGIQHFCYWTPLDADRGTAFEPGMITVDGKKTEIYDYVQTVNKEIQSFSNVMLSFEWTGTNNYLNERGEKNVGFNMVNTGTLGKNLGVEYPTKQHPRVKSVKNKEDMILGTFKDDKGYDGFMAVNYTDPGKNLSNDIEITFKDAKKAVVYIEGNRTVVDLKNGVYKASLKCGEGQFIIPFN